jgi:curved DNA-binding protein CbpA
MVDCYELLQISPNADSDTIHRVYKYLAARLHPDNLQTGDAAKFQRVKTAYDVLSNAQRRREYDAKRRELITACPLSSTIDFMDHLDGETNRRMAILAVLYYRRRTSPNFPDVPLAEIEERMGFPRDYLDFAMWYLVKKKYVLRSDNACFALTAEGVDFVEHERAVLPVLNGLLTSSTESTAEDGEEIAIRKAEAVPIRRDSANGSAQYAPSSTPGSHVGRRTARTDRRIGIDRRMGAPDERIIKIERRQNTEDRRVNLKDRRAGK